MKINKDTQNYVNITIFPEEQQKILRETHQIKTDGYCEFVLISQKEEETLLNIKYDGTWHYYLSIDYDEFNPSEYRGVTINKNNGDEDEEIIRINSGKVELDEKLALSTLYKMEGDVSVIYLSSYDDYYMDLNM